MHMTFPSFEDSKYSKNLRPWDLTSSYRVTPSREHSNSLGEVNVSFVLNHTFLFRIKKSIEKSKKITLKLH